MRRSLPSSRSRRPQSDLTPEDERLTEIAAQHHLRQELAPKQAGVCRLLSSAESIVVDGEVIRAPVPWQPGAVVQAGGREYGLRRGGLS